MEGLSWPRGPIHLVTTVASRLKWVGLSGRQQPAVAWADIGPADDHGEPGLQPGAEDCSLAPSTSAVAGEAGRELCGLGKMGLCSWSGGQEAEMVQQGHMSHPQSALRQLCKACAWPRA